MQLTGVCTVRLVVCSLRNSHNGANVSGSFACGSGALGLLGCAWGLGLIGIFVLASTPLESRRRACRAPSTHEARCAKRTPAKDKEQEFGNGEEI